MNCCTVLHLVDDEKIINRIRNLFEESLPDKNLFLCFLNPEGKAQLVKPAGNLFFVKNNQLPEGVDLSSIKKVVIHCLNYHKVLFYSTYIKQQLPTYWIMWGADIYNDLLYSKGYKLFYEPFYYYCQNWKTYIAKILIRLGLWINYRQEILGFIEHHVTHFISGKEEFDLMCHYYPKEMRNIKNREFFYYPIDDVLGAGLLHAKAEGNVILLGNSASFTNNHTYGMKFLSKVDIGDKCVKTPISYGGSVLWRNHIKRRGNRLFGKQYEPIEDFMSLADYNRLMITAEVYIYGSWRQEAFGNIVIALYLGAKVFLSNKSVLLKSFKRQGIILFELEKMTSESLLVPLSEEERMFNRDNMIKMFNKERLQAIVKELWDC